jgi:hypothetical protein
LAKVFHFEFATRSRIARLLVAERVISASNLHTGANGVALRHIPQAVAGTIRIRIVPEKGRP